MNASISINSSSSMLNRPIVFHVLLIAITLSVYSFSLRGDFVYDDREITVENNPAVTGNATVWEILQWDRPLREFTYMLDHAIWGFNPIGYHLQNVLWHAANVLLFFSLLQLFGLTASAAFCCSALFSLHPINTESVVWISGRKELLCLFFELTACIFFIRALQRNRLFNWRYIACLVSCILALLSKQVAVSLPILLAASYWLDRARRKESTSIKNCLQYLIPPAVIVLAFILFKYPVFEQLGFTRAHGTFYDPSARDVSYKLLSALFTPFATFIHSLWLCVWPMDLTVERSFPPVTEWADLRWMGGATASVSLLWLSVRWRNKRPEILFALIWFTAAWAPVSGLAPVAYLMADRYLYIPCLGFCIAAVAFAKPLLSFLEAKNPRICVEIVLLVCFAYAYRTIDRTSDWRNDMTLWESAIEARPTNAKAWTGLANAYADRGDIGRAFQVWNKSLSLDFNQPRVWVNMGNQEKKRGNPGGAEQCYRMALELFPDYGAAHFNLALLLEQLNKKKEALHHFQLAAEHLYHRVNTAYRKGLAYYHIARLLFSDGDRREAAYHLARAEKLAPSYAPIYLLKGVLSQNNPVAARKAFSTAIRLDPKSSQAYFNLGVLEWGVGNRQTADDLWNRAIEINPNLADAVAQIKK